MAPSAGVASVIVAAGAVTVRMIGTASNWLADCGAYRPSNPKNVPGAVSDVVFRLRFTEPGAVPVFADSVTLERPSTASWNGEVPVVASIVT